MKLPIDIVIFQNKYTHNRHVLIDYSIFDNLSNCGYLTFGLDNLYELLVLSEELKKKTLYD